MPTDQVTMLAGLLTFIRATTGAAAMVARAQYPDEQPDQSKTLVYIEAVGDDQEGFIGDRGPNTNPGGGNVDYAQRVHHVIRVEVWVASKPQAAIASKTIRDAYEQAGLIRQYMTRNKAGLLQTAGLHFEVTSRTRTMPADPQFPDWHRVGFYLTAWQDEVWTGAP